MDKIMSRGSEWGIWDLQIQTILDDRYSSLSEYYQTLKANNSDKWTQYVTKVGGESQALLYDSKEYFNDSSIPMKERRNNYVRNVFAFLETFRPELSLIGITDHNYYDDWLIDEFCNYSQKNQLKILAGIEINVAGVHMLAFFDKPPYGKPTFSEGLRTFLSKIDVDRPKSEGVLIVSQKSITKDVIIEIVDQKGIYIYPHCNSSNGLFQERGKTDRTHLADIYNTKASILLQGSSKENIENTKEYISKNPMLFRSVPIFMIASDSRSMKDYGSPDKNGNRLWVKADKTFKGLAQIINEPDRIVICDEPELLNRLRTNPTKFIDKLNIKKVDGSTIKEKWFENVDVALNPELVAIIGNKGKGKSALADVLGLCGNSHNMDYVSFLNKDKFKKPTPRNLSKEFIATIYWKSGGTDSKNLSENSDPNSYERVKYIPQNFLEALCTDVDKRIFEEELEKVIFSRLDDSKKLDKGSLREIINYKKELIEDAIASKKNELAKLNLEIVELEFKDTESYKKTIAETIQLKRNELASHIQNKPPTIPAPDQTPEIISKTKQITDRIDVLRDLIKRTQTQIQENSNSRTALQIQVIELTKLRDTFVQLKETIEKTVESNRKKIEEFGLILDSIITYSISVETIEVLIKEKQASIDSLNVGLSDENPEGLQSIIARSADEITKLQNELEGPSKEYQKHLTDLANWEKIKSDIEGTSTREGTLQYFISTQIYLENNLRNDLENKRMGRIEIVRTIIADKLKIVAIYKELYMPVTEFIEKNKNELSEYNVNIDVTLQLSEFESKFFSYVSNASAGSFYGASESRSVLEKITEVIDFNNSEQIINWLETLNSYLLTDMRDAQKSKRELRKQLKGGFKEIDLYNFLYGLDFLESRYQLKLGDKTLSELSPGERGALLLIFYLLLDKEDIPIIIDQPEENLDNQSVYKILVHFIKKAKQRRQIIIITHNPNLAVVCDAEQIIRTNIDKADGNYFTFKAGAIENSEINAEIVDVLEGTRPALDNRTDKYKISKDWVTT